LFGGVEAGTYSAIMPMLLSYFLALTIMVTPLLYLVGLLAPSWAPGIIAAPIVGVVYFKMVEISFLLVKGIFAVFQKVSKHSVSLVDGNIADFHDILLGMGYTMAFGISLV